MEAVIGLPFTFSILFVDAINEPMAVDNPTITVFNFSAIGAKQIWVDQQLMSPAVPAEVGRYIYSFTIPASFSDGEALYAEMTGTEVGPGLLCRAEQSLVAISSNRGTGGAYSGLTAHFIKGG